MKLSHRHGELRMRLDVLERGVLTTMLTDLGSALEPGALDENDPVRQRLYPAGHRDDAEAATEFRALTEESLVTQRVQRIAECLAQLEAGTDIVVDTEAGASWIAALNDLRLALGTRLGIEDEDHDEVDPDDPLAAQWAAYYWLTGLQDGLVHELMSR